jgi:hypothetical protein
MLLFHPVKLVPCLLVENPLAERHLADKHLIGIVLVLDNSNSFNS